MAIAHLRTYTINKGQMDSWLELFRERLTPLLAECDIDWAHMPMDTVSGHNNRYTSGQCFQNKQPLRFPVGGRYRQEVQRL